jgi:DNA helicase-2/ATP-dependent DNA helicase PcrA
VKDVLAYLKLAANPRDETSFDRAIGMPRRGVGDVSRSRFLDHARAAGLGLVEAALAAPGIAGLTRNAAEELHRLGSLLRTLQERESTMTADEALTFVVAESGIWNALAGEGAENESRRENVAELVAGARHFAARSEIPGFRAYLEEVSLRTDIDAWDPGADALTLMTAHNAKGLEFDVVFVAGLEEGLFPHASSSESEAGLEEERRLFYVALTRAKRHLTLSTCRARRRRGELMEAEPSPFLEELPREMLEFRELEEKALEAEDAARLFARMKEGLGRPGLA